MDYRYLNTINSPSDLKALPREALPEVCAELRDFIVSELSHNPGHLGSSLGVIELTVALHYVFDTPYDRLVWDVGHQAYAHKILTGRRDAFHTNRQFGGLAPFPTPAESEYDTCVSGHASNSISVALGMQVADSLLPESGAEGSSAGRRRKVVAVIGDGAMTGGLAFEGLNNASMDKNDLLIVLNERVYAVPGGSDHLTTVQQTALVGISGVGETAPYVRPQTRQTAAVQQQPQDHSYQAAQ